MIQLIILYNEYIGEPKLTEQKNPVGGRNNKLY